MVVSGSPKRWDRWHSPSPNWQEKYHWKIPLIVLAEPGGLYATDPTFYRNLKQPLTLGGIRLDVSVAT